jgi:hypothetical protein
MRATEHGLRIRILADPPHNPVTDDDERLREKHLVDLYQALSGNLGGRPAVRRELRQKLKDAAPEWVLRA